jgi:hypothetical protein
MRATTTKTQPSSATAEQQLRSFIAKFDSAHQTIIRAMRRILRKRLPAANELVWDNYNFFVIGYSATERPSDSVFSIAAAANGVGLSFYHGADLPDPHGVLEGSGVQNRFVRCPSANRLNDPEVEVVVDAAIAQARVPFSERGRGKLIIGSVSAKQKSRKKAKK